MHFYIFDSNNFLHIILLARRSHIIIRRSLLPQVFRNLSESFLLQKS